MAYLLSKRNYGIVNSQPVIVKSIFKTNLELLSNQSVPLNASIIYTSYHYMPSHLLALLNPRYPSCIERIAQRSPYPKSKFLDFPIPRTG